MELRLDDGQVALQDTVRRFCEDRFGLDRIGEREDRPTDRAAWQELGSLGALGVLDVLRFGVVEAAVTFEQLGSHLVPGPVLWSVLAAPFVDGAATGDVLVGGLADDDGPLLVEHAAEIDALVVLRPDGVFLVAGDDLPRPEELAPLDALAVGTTLGRVVA